MKIFYNPNEGIVLPDGKIDEFVKHVMEDKHDILVGSELIILGIRAYMKQNNIDPSTVTIIQNGNQEVRIVGKNYKLVSNHELYVEQSSKYLDILLGIE